MFDIEKRPKFLFIDIDGNPIPVYLDDLPKDVYDTAIKNENIGNDVQHRFVIPYAVKKVLNNRNLRKACHNKGYLDTIKESLKENYIVLVDITNYNNYHRGKKHEGTLFHNSVITENQHEYLNELHNILNTYNFVRCEEMCPNGQVVSIMYDDFCTKYGIGGDEKRI